MDEMRDVITELEHGVPPLPKDLLWIMSIGDKNNSGQITKGEVFVNVFVYVCHSVCVCLFVHISISIPLCRISIPLSLPI